LLTIVAGGAYLSSTPKRRKAAIPAWVFLDFRIEVDDPSLWDQIAQRDHCVRHSAFSRVAARRSILKARRMPRRPSSNILELIAE